MVEAVWEGVDSVAATGKFGDYTAPPCKDDSDSACRRMPVSHESSTTGIALRSNRTVCYMTRDLRSSTSNFFAYIFFFFHPTDVCRRRCQ